MVVLAIICTLQFLTLAFGVGGITTQMKWDIDWRSSDLNLIPPLPIAAPNSANPRCRQDSIRLVEALTNMTLWAEQSKFNDPYRQRFESSRAVYLKLIIHTHQHLASIIYSPLCVKRVDLISAMCWLKLTVDSTRNLFFA